MNFHQKPITFVSNVEINVQDLERSINYYQKVVGLNVLEKTDTTAKLTTDGKSNILTLVQPTDAEPKQGRTTGLYHFAILLPTRKDLADFVFHTINIGLPIGSSDHLVSEALYFNDPDGNGIEIYRDRDPSEWDWPNGEVKMAVDPLDFEDLLKEGQQGDWNGLPDSTLMGHIHLHVADIQQTKNFYEKGLGFETVCHFGDQALFISTGKYHHHIGLNTWNGVGAPTPPSNSAGLASFTLTYPDQEAIEEVVKNLQAIGASINNEQGKTIAIDPSGNQIILKA